MRLKGLTFILTEECNWRCSYCYQPPGKTRISRAALSRACEAFFPRLADKCSISFTGGEPLLVPGLIRHVLAELKKFNAIAGGKKRFRYLLTTNGSRLNPGLLDFLEENRFEVLLSYDGPAQDEGRCPQSSLGTGRLLDRLLSGGLRRVGTNTVFTPGSVGRLSATLRNLAERGVSEVLFSFCVCSSWDRPSRRAAESELSKVRRWLLDFYIKNQTVPLVPFRKSRPQGIFSCSGGRDTLALAADGTLWGCHLFSDYFRGRGDDRRARDFCFGRPGNSFPPSGAFFRRIQKNYSQLGMDHLRKDKTFCLTCDDVEECSVCPAAAAFSSGEVGRVSRDTCWASRELIRQRRRFWQEAEGRAFRPLPVAPRRLLQPPSHRARHP